VMQHDARCSRSRRDDNIANHHDSSADQSGM
jgi:hypothetical protein